MKFTIVAYFLFLNCCIVFGQIGGESTYQFLNLETSPKSAALGGKLVADYDNDPISGLFNPATINVKMANNYSVNFANYIGDVSYGSAATAFRIKRSLKMIHVGVIYANYGTFDGFDLQGNSTGEFKANTTAISVGHSRRVSDTDFYIGLSAKFINAKFEQYVSYALAGDMGISYIDEVKKLNIGLSIRNVGAELKTFEETKESLPLEINLGISKTLAKAPLKWYITLQNLQRWNLAFANENRDTESLLGGDTEVDDPGFFNNVLRHVNLGAEFFPEKAFNIRVGYNFRRSEELKIVEQRSFSGFSAGFALRIRKLKFNYSYVRYNSAATASLFGLNLNFGEYK